MFGIGDKNSSSFRCDVNGVVPETPVTSPSIDALTNANHLRPTYVGLPNRATNQSLHGGQVFFPPWITGFCEKHLLTYLPTCTRLASLLF